MLTEHAWFPSRAGYHHFVTIWPSANWLGLLWWLAARGLMLLGAMSDAEARHALARWVRAPVFHGFHGWHLDGGTGTALEAQSALEWPRTDKLWILVQKSSSASGVADTGASAWTNMRIVPSDARARYAAELDLRVRHGCKRSREALLERISCVTRASPGDVLYYRGDLLHRTQDTWYSRVALTVDVQI